jgi:hypothetical protein
MHAVKAAMTRGAKYLPVDTTPSLILPAAIPVRPDRFPRSEFISLIMRPAVSMAILPISVGMRTGFRRKSWQSSSCSSCLNLERHSGRCQAQALVRRGGNLAVFWYGEQSAHCRIETLSIP